MYPHPPRAGIPARPAARVPPRSLSLSQVPGGADRRRSDAQADPPVPANPRHRHEPARRGSRVFSATMKLTYPSIALPLLAAVGIAAGDPLSQDLAPDRIEGTL